MKKIAPHWQILIALVLATGTAIVFRNLSQIVASDSTAYHFIEGVISVGDFLGKLFIQALKMIIVPLVASSIIAGIASLGEMKGFGRLGMKTLGFYMGTSFAAVLVGLVLVNTIQPGLENGKPNIEIRDALQQKAEGASSSEKEKVVQAGERKAGDHEVLRLAAGIAARKLNARGVGRATFLIPAGGDAADARAVVEGAGLGMYRFDRYIGSSKKPNLKHGSVSPEGAKVAGLAAALRVEGGAVADDFDEIAGLGNAHLFTIYKQRYHLSLTHHALVAGELRIGGAVG